MKSFVFLTVTLCSFSLKADRAEAQLFGRRNLGGSISRRSIRGSQTNVVSGAERFIRGNRRRSNFVGSDPRRFVGAQFGEPIGRSRGPVSQSRKTQARRIVNPPYPALQKNGPYEPRLEIAFESQSTNSTVTSALTSRLESLQGLQRLGSISVSVQDQTAKLRGEVVSARARDLAELVVLFEPGISSVSNELVVNVKFRVAPPPPPADRELTPQKKRP